MPIYSYRCETCGHQADVLQKMSDPLLVTCPSCGAPTYRKQVTAAGFQLKGSGWYVTDFRNSGNKEASTTGASKSGEGAAPAAAPASDAPAAAAPATESSSKSDSTPAKTPPTPTGST